jgi:hypothetical protein
MSTNNVFDFLKARSQADLKQRGILLPSRSKNAYFESYKISAKPREIKACGILQSGRFMSEKGVSPSV